MDKTRIVVYVMFVIEQIKDKIDHLSKGHFFMENKLSGVLAATLALTMSLPTGAIASSSSKTSVVF